MLHIVWRVSPTFTVVLPICPPAKRVFAALVLTQLKHARSRLAVAEVVPVHVWEIVVVSEPPDGAPAVTVPEIIENPLVVATVAVHEVSVNAGTWPLDADTIVKVTFWVVVLAVQVAALETPCTLRSMQSIPVFTTWTVGSRV